MGRMPGFRISVVQEWFELDPKKTVLEHVEEAVAGTRALLHRFEELYAQPLPSLETGTP